MLQYFNQLSGKRGAWLLLALTAMLFEAIALWFQHVMLLKPCVLCIYQRCAMLGIVGAGLLGFIAPKTPLRYAALLVWLYSAWEGLQLAWQHTSLQLHPSPFASCEFATRFPDWLPLNNWLPSIFAATGDCAEKQWSFLTLEMPQWLVGIFAAYLIVGLLVLITQPFRPKRRDLFSR